MTVAEDISIDVDWKSALRRQGVRSDRELRPELRARLEESRAELDGLLRPQISYDLYQVEAMEPDRVCLERAVSIEGELLPRRLGEARALAVAACTIGPLLEERVTALSSGGERLRALMLDGLGTSAVDQLCLTLHERVVDDVEARGLHASGPLVPGMHGLALSEQTHVLALARARRIGIRLTSSNLMVPRKSVSMVIGVGENLKRWTSEDFCSMCPLQATCPYRIRTKEERSAAG